MRVLVARGGKYVKTDDPVLGQPLLYSTKEWFERRRAVSGRYHTTLLLTYFLTFFIVWFLVDFIVRDPFRGGFHWMWLAALYFLLFGGLPSLGEVWHHRRDKKLGLCSGLYPEGIFFRAFGYPTRIFVPYDQIESFTPKSWLTMEALTLKVRGNRLKRRFTLMPSILGPDGLVLLKQKVSGLPEPVEPPKLVVYGGPRFRMGQGPSQDIIPPPSKRM